MGEAAEQTINTHHLTLPFGKHQNEPVTRVPVSYLRWMASSVTTSGPDADHSWADVAMAELNRRGAIIPNVEISGHAIDTASLRVLPIWQRDANEGEGLYGWLARRADAARTFGVPSTRNEGRYHYLGIKWVLDEAGPLPVLKTVIRER